MIKKILFVVILAMVLVSCKTTTTVVHKVLVTYTTGDTELVYIQMEVSTAQYLSLDEGCLHSNGISVRCQVRKFNIIQTITVK